MDTPQELTEEQKLNALKAKAVKQAMFEVVGEQRKEIVKRAAAKLSAMGIAVEQDELGDIS